MEKEKQEARVEIDQAISKQQKKLEDATARAIMFNEKTLEMRRKIQVSFSITIMLFMKACAHVYFSLLIFILFYMIFLVVSYQKTLNDIKREEVLAANARKQEQHQLAQTRLLETAKTKAIANAEHGQDKLVTKCSFSLINS